VINKKCFVCQNNVPTDNLELNQEVNLLVCSNCKGTPKEKQAVNELLESLADGFVCGCI
jgi:hypothetical protein